MIKIFLAFVVFAALALYMLMQGGDIDMSGEKHGLAAPQSEPVKPKTPTAAIRANFVSHHSV